MKILTIAILLALPMVSYAGNDCRSEKRLSFENSTEAYQFLVAAAVFENFPSEIQRSAFIRKDIIACVRDYLMAPPSSEALDSLNVFFCLTPEKEKHWTMVLEGRHLDNNTITEKSCLVGTFGSGGGDSIR
ncbi:MAG: hypothetical protein CL678_15075 [Bdellovibrionaceae bacterium]|nr:hypothetical protein [Pseudobdellovibrionaceae bacterium]|tara:strand:- start:8858 stop:9250 length:393 start_codon:yes stop_codon:yes gene_type:complete